jgi:hypothetical protein
MKSLKIFLTAIFCSFVLTSCSLNATLTQLAVPDDPIAKKIAPRVTAHKNIEFIDEMIVNTVNGRPLVYLDLKVKLQSDEIEIVNYVGNIIFDEYGRRDVHVAITMSNGGTVLPAHIWDIDNGIWVESNWFGNYEEQAEEGRPFNESLSG